MDLTEEIRRIVESNLAPGQFLVDVVTSSRQGPRKIMVLVDGDQGIGIDDCAAISRHLSKSLDEAGLVEDNYTLEVSTPGVDHPLKLKRQYTKNIGRNVKVKLPDRILEGKLSAVTEDKIDLIQQIGSGKKMEEKLVEVPFSEITQAFVLVSFK
jgi:ribosome maturation factor RimP